MTRRWIPLLALLAAGCAHWGATRRRPPRLRADARSLDAFLRRQMSAGGFVGLQVAVVHHGKTLLSRGYGRRTITGSDPVRVDTRFGIGSVTKQFVCALALQLAQEGKLSLRDPVARYFPGLARAREIRLLDLLSHRSGYPDYYPLDFVDRRMQKPVTAHELIQRYATGKLDFPPRTRWSYSNTGFIIAGRVLEKVTGKPLVSLLQRRLFTPLGMVHTRLAAELAGAQVAQGTTSFALSRPRPAPREARGWLGAAGGLYSTAADLVKWSLALVDGRALAPASLELMTRPLPLARGRRSSYGCGLGVGYRRGTFLWGHGGSVAGFVTFNTVIPETRSAVAITANVEQYARVRKIQRRLVDALLPRSTARGPEVPRVAGPPAVALVREWLGRFQTGRIDRRQLGAEFSAYLTPARVRGAASRLSALGAPDEVVVRSWHERGGMEVAVVRLTFGKRALRALLYRSPDGKIQELLFKRD